MFVAALIILIGIPSGPVALFGFNDFIMVLISFVLALGKVNVSLTLTTF